MFMFADYYATHPVLQKISTEGQVHGEIFPNFNSVFDLSLSLNDNEYPHGAPLTEVVQCEAKRTCVSGTWVGLMSLLALSTVIRRNIDVIYPDCSDNPYKILFGSQIHPRIPIISCGDIKILFIMHGKKVKAGDGYKSNHFIPCIFASKDNLKKRKPDTDFALCKRKKTQHLQMQAKIPYWTEKFNENLVFPQIKKEKITSKINIDDNASYVGSPLSKFSASSINFINSCAYIPAATTHTSSCATKTATYGSVSAAKICSSSSVFTPNSSTLSSSAPFWQVSSITAASTLSFHSTSTLTSLSASSKRVSVSNQWDISGYRTKVIGLDNIGIQELIKNVFKPDSNFVFPKSNGRSFRYSWLNSFPWLCYSAVLDGAFCLPCVLFGDKLPNKVSKIRKLFSEPFNHWSDACAAFKRHENVVNSGIHNQSMAIYSSILSKSLPVDVLINSNRKRTITQNRKKLVPIVDAIIVCGRQGLALRGHRDDRIYQPTPGNYSIEQTGNFVELLNFRIRGGDKFLEEHLSKCPDNSTYISKTTQNEIINCCGEVITKKIVNQIKNNKFFSVIADELLDCSNKEQLSLVIRYVDDNNNIREDFLKFLHCESGLTGLDLSELVLEALDDLTLDFDYCRGQAYDGAGNVSGHLSGLSAHLLTVNQKAIYVHCNSHRLNLCVAKSCSVTLVRNVMNKVKSLSYFFNSSQKRQQLLQNNIAEYCPATTKSKLKDVCRTRWVERIDGMEVFEEVFVPLYVTLDDMSVNLNKICNHDTASQALSFFNDISNFEFIVSLVITRNVLSLTHSVTTLLQDRSIDIMDNISHIDNLKNTVMNCRNKVNVYHDKWYKEALDLADKVGVEEKRKRVVKRQTLRDNHPSFSTKDYYRNAITIPLLDHLICELQTRFDFSSVTVYNGLCIVPAKMISLIYSNSDWKKTFKAFANFYKCDLPNPLALDADLELWENFWLNFSGTRPETVAETLKSGNMKMFPNLNQVMRILATIPVTSCECERTFSALRRLKNYSRGTMGASRLNGLSLMYIHQDIVPDVNEVIDLFAADNRRLELI